MSGRTRAPVLSPAEEAAVRFDAIVACALLVVAFAFGGASRPDAFSQMLVRLFALGFAGVALLRIDHARWRRSRVPVMGVGVLALVVAVQLVPLPPSLWAALPGHGDFAAALRTAGVAERWRPLSLTPDLTLNSLLSLLPALAAALVFGALNPRAWRYVLPALLVLVGASALMSLIQLSTGTLYLYSVTNQGAGVGVFANRNHQALLLATALPLLAAWLATGRGGARDARTLRVVIAAAAAVAVFPFLLITGSRAGLIEGVAGLMMTAVLLPPRLGGATGWRGRALRFAPVVAGGIVLALALGSGRDVALGRLLDSSQAELRTENLPVYGDMIRAFFPFGAGFGSFDPIFRHMEPFSALRPSYMNHAHSDPLEIVMEGGLIAGVLAVAFMAWLARTALPVCRGGPASSAIVLGRAGAIIVVLALIGSIADYPLRTPLIGVLFVLCCTWLRGAAVDRTATTRLAAQPA